MRSRDVRPFAVEIKSKRRPTASLPPSLWGDAVKLFKTEQDRGRNPLPGSGILDLTASAHSVKPQVEIQPKRILPDLRVTEVQVDAEPVAVRVRRTRRMTGGKTMLEDAERQGQHQMEPAPSAPGLKADPAPSNWIELTSLDQASEDEGSASGLPTSSEIVVLTEAQTASADAPVVVPHQEHGRARRWLRKADELPRAERWKRRLPEVCR